MAPEQIAGDEVDARADLYAWGVLAYEILAGAHPFEGKTNAQQLLAAHLTESAAPLSARAPNAPEALASLVVRCLAKGAADRPQSARELIEVLDGVSVTPGTGVDAWGARSCRDAMGDWRIARRALGRPRGHARATPTSDRGCALRALLHDTAAPRIVVLPLENRGVARDEFFADGMTDAIRGQLAQNAALAVLGPGAASRYKHTTKTPREIAPRARRALPAHGHGAVGTRTRRLEPRAHQPRARGRARRDDEVAAVVRHGARERLRRAVGDRAQRRRCYRRGARRSRGCRRAGASSVAAPRGANLTAYTLYLKALAEYRHFGRRPQCRGG